MANARMEISSETDTLSLDGIRQTGFGVQAQPGVTGLGLPARRVQWLESAGDGALYRGHRNLPRDVDIPLEIHGADYDDLLTYWNRLANILAGPCTLTFIDNNGDEWTLAPCVLVGGGQWAFGLDHLGDNDLRTVITLRSSDPFWQSSSGTHSILGSEPE